MPDIEMILVEEMNAVKSHKDFLPVKKAVELEVGKVYRAETIRKVKTKYGTPYVIESEDFQIFLPKCFDKLHLTEFVPSRNFLLVSIKKLPNGGFSPKYQFFIGNAI